MTAGEAARFLLHATNERVATEADVLNSQMVQDTLATAAARRLGEAIAALKSQPYQIVRGTKFPTESTR